MRIIFKTAKDKKPLVSIVLIDWSVRHSAHMLDYLNLQDVDRDQYEIIWIEYYNRQLKDIETRLKESISNRKNPILDQWIILEIPNEYYYHKHLMYNVGILSSIGNIVVFCDSDTIVKPTFLKSITGEFNKDSNIVLHIDELRNINRKFYPFNYPSIEDVINSECLNAIGGKPEWFFNRVDPFHMRNYGACMCCLRQDIIDIGGADENLGYLGYICGPYEMTFRLVNVGKKEVWSEDELLYHTWHPEAGGWQKGARGKGNYHGPHDGRSVSQAALEVISSGRVLPLLENRFIKELRLNRNNAFFSCNFQLALSDEWKKGSAFLNKDSISLFRKIHLKLKIILLHYFLLFYIKHIFKKGHLKMSNPSSRRYILSFIDCFSKFCWALKTLKERWQYSMYLLEVCLERINDLKRKNINMVIIYGRGEIAKAVYLIARYFLINIRAIYSDISQEIDMSLWQESQGCNDGIIIVNSDMYNINDISNRIKKLVMIGIPRGSIVVII